MNEKVTFEQLTDIWNTFIANLLISINDQKEIEKENLIIEFENTEINDTEYKILFDLKENKIISKKYGKKCFGKHQNKVGEEYLNHRYIMENTDLKDQLYLLNLFTSNLNFLQTLYKTDIEKYKLVCQQNIKSNSVTTKCYINEAKVELLDMKGKSWIVSIKGQSGLLIESEHPEQNQIFSIYPYKHRKAFQKFWDGDFVYLTAMEKEVLSLLQTCSSINKAATILFISKETVRKHCTNIYKKLFVHNLSGALNFSILINLRDK